MTLRDLQPLLESPFRNYANFSGRAGRAEFWLFLLSLFVATNLAWIIGYGGMMLAGYQSHDHRYETYHHTHAPDDDPGTNGPSLSHMGHEGHEEYDSQVIFKFHRHSSEEGYHLHGSIDAEHFLDEDHRRDDAKGRAHTHNVSGTLQSSWQNINHPVLPRPKSGTVSPHVSADHHPSSAREACFCY